MTHVLEALCQAVRMDQSKMSFARHDEGLIEISVLRVGHMPAVVRSV